MNLFNRVAIISLSLALVACGGDDPDPDAGTTPDAGMGGTDSGPPDTDSGPPDTDAGPPDTDAGTADSGTDAGTADGWVVRSHPCPGVNRTDALMVDTDGSIWIGCGSGTDGDGLYVSSDDGASWAIPTTNPSSILDNFRVLSIHRGYGGLVYVSGEGPASTMVISLDTSSTPYAAASVLTRGTTVGRSFLASPFVTLPSGAAFVDSFVGHDALYRADDSVDDTANNWTDASAWEDDSGTSHQILDMVAVGEDLYGCGSTISEPPYVFLPSTTASEPYAMTPVQLVSGLAAFDGEMWGVAASADRVVVVGINQDANIGKIFVSGADRYTAADYSNLDVDTYIPTRLSASDRTWARGVCMRGDRVIVVGEIQPLGRGAFAIESTDGGATFTDVTPDSGTDTWSKCHIEASGRLVLAGASTVAILE